MLPHYSNLLLRLHSLSGEVEGPEFYAKVLPSTDGFANRHLIHFTSITPGVRARLDTLAGSGG